MDKAISQLRLLIENVLSDFKFIDKTRLGTWISEGDYLNSKVEITLENDEIDYELKFFLSKSGEEILTPHEIFVLLHEMSHIVILEKIRVEKGIEDVKKYIDKYRDDIELLNEKAEKGKWGAGQIQMEYEEIEFEKQTDIITKELFARYLTIAS